MPKSGTRRIFHACPTGCPRNPLELAFPGRRGARRGVGVLFQLSTHRGGKAVKVNPWNDYLAAAGIVAAKRHDGRRPRPAHDFRHTCAASLVSGWYPLQGRRRPGEGTAKVASPMHAPARRRRRVVNAMHERARRPRQTVRRTTRVGYTLAPDPSRSSIETAGTPGRTRTCDPRLRRPSGRSARSRA